MSSMKAVVIREAGGPDVLNVETMAVPTPKSGWVLIRVRAFGLNRSELFTRQGHSPNVPFPRVLGIEAVGEVISAPDGGFGEGDTVATAMGGMGREYDGGYAEYTLVPAGQVQQLDVGGPDGSNYCQERRFTRAGYISERGTARYVTKEWR
jgi:NADPH:quinone reductase-like Zn-dependent oxidoreductase